MALNLAIKYEAKDLIIHSDSTYVIDTAQKWLKTWTKNGWQLSNGNKPTNLKAIQHFDSLLSQIKVKWVSSF
jgi:ribonuclease HI